MRTYNLIFVVCNGIFEIEINTGITFHVYGSGKPKELGEVVAQRYDLTASFNLLPTPNLHIIRNDIIDIPLDNILEYRIQSKLATHKFMGLPLYTNDDYDLVTRQQFFERLTEERKESLSKGKAVTFEVISYRYEEVNEEIV